MKELTPNDIQKISLYIPFKVAFAPLNQVSVMTRSYPVGIIESIVIASFDDFDSAREICESWDLLHHEMDERPVLRKLGNMTQHELEMFISLFDPESALSMYTRQDVCDCVMKRANPATFAYALSRHFDLFGLIDAGKATGLDT